jgi:hypothetical protein
MDGNLRHTENGINEDNVGGYGVHDENCKIHMAGLQNQYR